MKKERKRLLRWVGSLAGVPLVAAAYRRAASRRAERSNGQLIVRTSVEPELLADLVEYVRSVRGRAALDGPARLSVPVPSGVDEYAAYRELSTLLARWEARHPGVRVEIVSPRPTRAGPDERPLNRSGVRAIKRGWRTKSD